MSAARVVPSEDEEEVEVAGATFRVSNPAREVGASHCRAVYCGTLANVATEGTCLGAGASQFGRQCPTLLF